MSAKRRHLVSVSTDERIVLAFYRTAPEMLRALVVSMLVDALNQPVEHERAGINKRAGREFRALGLSKRVAQVTHFAVNARRTVLGLTGKDA
jgi:hypothetical protein